MSTTQSAAWVSSRPSDPALVATLRAAGCVFAEDEAALLVEAAGSQEELAALVERRCAGEPLEVVVGWAEFCGLRLIVEAGVFVPRRRTEALAREAVKRIGPGAIVVELCCGVGPVSAVVLETVPGAIVYAADIDPVAARCARRNVELRGGRVFQGNLYEPLPTKLRGAVDVLVANAPYVPTDEIRLMPAEARDHEPSHTLDGGPDGLAVHRRIIAEAPEWLAPTGALLIETSRHQARAAATAMRQAALRPSVLTTGDDEATVIVGISPEP